MTTNAPTKDGHYWLRYKNSFGTYDRPDIVFVCLKYKHRNKETPYVLARFWKGPLSDFLDPKMGSEWVYIECPFEAPPF